MLLLPYPTGSSLRASAAHSRRPPRDRRGQGPDDVANVAEGYCTRTVTGIGLCAERTKRMPTIVVAITSAQVANTSGFAALAPMRATRIARAIWPRGSVRHASA